MNKVNTEKKQIKEKQPQVRIKYSLFDKVFFVLKMFVFAAICAGLFYFYNNAKKFANKIELIYELQCIIKNLKANYPVADLTITDISEDYISVTINFYNRDGSKVVGKEQSFSIRGNTIYLDCTVYNFAFSLIETGEVKNFAIPFRIYSDVVPPDNGIILQNCNMAGVPFVLYDAANAEDQAARDLQKKRLTKLMQIVNNPFKAEQLGILRSMQKNAVGNASLLKKGNIFILKTEQTGGLSLKKKGFFD